MTFFCKNLESDVDLEDCPECDEYRQCKDSGYYDEIKAKNDEYSTSVFGNYTDTQLDSFNKRIRRTLDTGYLCRKRSKDLYDYMDSGMPNIPNISEEDFIPIIKETGLNIKVVDLYNDAFRYLFSKSIWDRKPNPSELKVIGEKKIKKIINITNKLLKDTDELIRHLESSDKNTFQLLHKYFCESTKIREKTPEELKVIEIKSKEQLRRFLSKNMIHVGLTVYQWHELSFEQLRDAVIDTLRENERVVPNDLNAFLRELYTVAPLIKSFAQAIKKIQTEIISKNNKLTYFPFVEFCLSLANLYRHAAGKEPSLPHTGHDKRNNFFYLVVQCVTLVDPDFIKKNSQNPALI